MTTFRNIAGKNNPHLFFSLYPRQGCDVPYQDENLCHGDEGRQYGAA